MKSVFQTGSRIEIIDMDMYGTIRSIRVDDRSDSIYGIELDDPSATPDGFFIARNFEIRRLS